MANPPFQLPVPWDEDANPNDEGLAPWDEEMYWAERHDWRPLVASLLAGTPINSDDRRVREFLAGVLAGKIKRPVGKPPRRMRGTFAIDFDGQVIWIKPDGKDWYAAAAQVRSLLAVGARKSRDRHVYDDAVKDAAKKFKLKVESLHKWLKSSKKERVERFGIRTPR